MDELCNIKIGGHLSGFCAPEGLFLIFHRPANIPIGHQMATAAALCPAYTIHEYAPNHSGQNVPYASRAPLDTCIWVSALCQMVSEATRRTRIAAPVTHTPESTACPARGAVVHKHPITAATFPAISLTSISLRSPPLLPVPLLPSSLAGACGGVAPDDIRPP